MTIQAANIDNRDNHDDREACRDEWRRSLADLPGYWAGRAEAMVTWFKKWDSVLQGDFNTGGVTWFAGAQLNASFNCLDRHLVNGRRNKAALVWVGEKNEDTKTYTY